LKNSWATPSPPETEHAKRVLNALKKWGRQAFDALFDNRQGADFLRDAQENGRYDRLTLQIASDDPRILAWPWETPFVVVGGSLTRKPHCWKATQFSQGTTANSLKNARPPCNRSSLFTRTRTGAT
jgi:hypothetical protein